MKSKKGKSKKGKSKTTGPYDKNFDQVLDDENIFFTSDMEGVTPKNYDDIKRRMDAERPSESITDISNQYLDFIR